MNQPRRLHRFSQEVRVKKLLIIVKFKSKLIMICLQKSKSKYQIKARRESAKVVRILANSSRRRIILKKNYNSY